MSLKFDQFTFIMLSFEGPRASIVDLEMTLVVDGDLVKVMIWYDNEWGFTNNPIIGQATKREGDNKQFNTCECGERM
jgi:glyceraldehyde-3-phosphate dehydrogenase/erythrose-4-phosphate dehydrogenase